MLTGIFIRENPEQIEDFSVHFCAMLRTLIWSIENLFPKTINPESRACHLTTDMQIKTRGWTPLLFPHTVRHRMFLSRKEDSDTLLKEFCSGPMGLIHKPYWAIRMGPESPISARAKAPI